MSPRPRPPRMAKQEGFSLIEIMVAMTFLGIGLLAIAQLIPMGMVGITDARIRTNAVQTGQQVLDQLRATDFDEPALTAGTYTQSDGRYNLVWTITDNVPVPGMKRVDLNATWGDSADVDTVSFSTYLTPSQ